MTARRTVITCSLVFLGSVPSALAQELWVAPTYQSDFGGLGIGSNGFWPASAIGAVRFGFAMPADLQSLRSVKVALIPHASGASTLTVYACRAANGNAVTALCNGPVNHAFTGVANQLREVDITAAVSPQVGPGDTGRYVTVVAFSTPSAATDHFLGLRFSYRSPLFADIFTSSYNTVLGLDAATPGFTLGARNTAVGGASMRFGTSGSDNTGLGFGTLFNMNNPAFNTGGSNTAVGSHALHEVTTGSNNTAVGANSMYELHEGNNNSALGVNTLLSVGPGSQNTAVGNNALRYMSNGDRNTAVGVAALSAGPIPGLGGSHNVAVGYRADVLALNASSHNIYVANEGDDESNTTRIGTAYNAPAQSGQNRTFIAGIRGVTTGVANGITVLIDSNGQLGTISSSRRYKEDIRDLADASSGLMRLRPVQFRYKDAYADGSKPAEYGLIAEEVADVFPNLVVYDRDGRPETVQYHKLVPMLLNEMQKLQRQVEELKARLGGGNPQP